MQPKSYHNYTYADKIVEDYALIDKYEREAQLHDRPYTDADAPTEAEVESFLDDMYQMEVEYRKQLFQYAQSKFNQLHPFSRPDSLTRRGNVIVLRRYVALRDNPKWDLEDWKQTVLDVFDNRVTIHHADIGVDKNLRIWFTPHSTQDLNKGWL